MKKWLLFSKGELANLNPEWKTGLPMKLSCLSGVNWETGLLSVSFSGEMIKLEPRRNSLGIGSLKYWKNNIKKKYFTQLEVSVYSDSH